MLIVTIIGFLITIISIYLVGYMNRVESDYIFPFDDTIGINNVPIVSFIHNNKTVNFIIDSGSSNSIININAIQDFEHKLLKTKNDSHVSGIDGNRIKTTLTYIELTKDNHTFSDIFQIMPIPGIDNINKRCEGSIVIHGIIGNTFLKKYQFLIDYKYLKASSNG